MPPIKRPMLAAQDQPILNQLRYPLLASPKLDGIRCLILDGVAHTRRWREWPNRNIRETLAGLGDLDGEVVKLGDDGKPLPFNECQSLLDTYGEYKFEYWVFDCFTYPEKEFFERLKLLDAQVAFAAQALPVRIVPQIRVEDLPQLQAIESHYLKEGYEGLILRDPMAPYKQGRSTLKQGWMLKLKQFEDAEATVESCEELLHNMNELEQDKLGFAKRSSRADGKVGGDTLGVLVCRAADGTEVRLGTGFEDEMREVIWSARRSGKGMVVKYKFQRHGTMDAPRIPVFLGFRGSDDTGS